MAYRLGAQKIVMAEFCKLFQFDIPTPTLSRQHAYEQPTDRKERKANPPFRIAFAESVSSEENPEDDQENARYGTVKC